MICDWTNQSGDVAATATAQVLAATEKAPRVVHQNTPRDMTARIALRLLSATSLSLKSRDQP